MKISRSVSIIFAGFLLCAGLLCHVGNADAAKKMPEFSLKTVAGDQVVDSTALRGKILLINFWATWCPPCRKEIPFLMELHKKYQRKEFSVIGISLDQGGKRLVQKFVDKLQINYPIVIGDAKIAKSFGGVVGIPVSFLVDREGNLVKRYDGYVSENILAKDIERLLD
ncbi:MAG: TlpA family protein disulfide reductase [Proteobacteria bacterium]|nr:TlpA family protein disulfide reductase [Pseudomonadota bacterium]MBU1739395.1 TlpA family protein disulfide reductase [Pseudomonadota bacterium]